MYHIKPLIYLQYNFKKQLYIYFKLYYTLKRVGKILYIYCEHRLIALWTTL
jgi:hypothetical protein